MAEYIKREVALNRLETLKKPITPIEENRDLFYHDSGINGAITGAILEVKKIPAADVVEVVRCKDCIHCQKNWTGFVCGNVYAPFYSDEYYAQMNENDFCSYGERKADEQKR